MICVDGMTDCTSKGKWRWRKSCHLFDDEGNSEVLHKFAAEIGLRRRWVHVGTKLLHYDLINSKRQLAVRLGAKEVSRRFVANLLRKNKEIRQ